MKKIFPPKLIRGDTIRIIAPSSSLAIIKNNLQRIAKNRLEKMGLIVTFAKHSNENDDFESSSIKSRIADLHEAFKNKEIKAVICVIGGYNANQILDYIDWKLIKKNPKILVGYSDITILNNAFFAKTGLVTYSGPTFSMLANKNDIDYSIEYYKKCLFGNDSFGIIPSKKWSDGKWYKKDKVIKKKNDGSWIMNKGTGKGTIIGGNLCTLNLLQGTQYMPSLKKYYATHRRKCICRGKQCKRI